jgi:hypothetical protein
VWSFCKVVKLSWFVRELCAISSSRVSEITEITESIGNLIYTFFHAVAFRLSLEDISEITLFFEWVGLFQVDARRVVNLATATGELVKIVAWAWVLARLRISSRKKF